MTGLAELTSVDTRAATIPGTCMLRVRDLKKSFKRPIVDGVDLEVGAGEIVGLLGANGAGKTTTFRMVMGMIPPDAGSVTFLDQDVTRWPMHRRARSGLGYLSQQESVFRDLTVEENLLIVLERLSLTRAERRKRRDALLDEFGLAIAREQPAWTLSGGQKRRLEVARALIPGPRLVLFDEPWAGVDPIARGDIQAIVFGLRRRGIAVFITDHDAERVLLTVDRVYLMHEGKVVVHGTPREVLASEVARRVYLGHDFRLDLDAKPAAPAAPAGEPPASARAAGEVA